MQLSVPEGMAYKTKQEFVYRTLRTAILRCEVAPGQRLPTQEIADRLGVSLIPVREALQLLQSEGLVENRAHVGAVAARVSGSSVAEVFALLEGLETVAVRVAARRMPPAEVEALARLVTEMDSALDDGEYELWGELNTQFHLSIARSAGMPVLRDMTERAFDLWYRVQRCFFTEVLLQRVLQSQREHHGILRALRDRNEEELEQLVKVHNRNAMEAYTNYLSNGSTGSGDERIMNGASKTRGVGTRTPS
jgi:DNA-binding GntR family transcriptional regulator